MKIAAYNVMAGGFSSYEKNSESVRPPLIKEAIKKIDADFIGLIDTFRWTEIFSTEKLKSFFNYPFVFQTLLEDSRVPAEIGLTILSRVPVKKFEALRLQNRNCLKAEIEFKRKKINFFTVYLDYEKENIRVRQIKSLLDKVDPTGLNIILGDLNAVCPEEVGQLKKLAKDLLKTIPFFASIANDLFRAETIELIRKRGFREAENAKENTFPTPLFMHLSLPVIRVDHLFSSPNLKITDFKVLTGGVFKRASDHYPIVTELNLLG